MLSIPYGQAVSCLYLMTLTCYGICLIYLHNRHPESDIFCQLSKITLHEQIAVKGQAIFDIQFMFVLYFVMILTGYFLCDCRL